MQLSRGASPAVVGLLTLIALSSVIHGKSLSRIQRETVKKEGDMLFKQATWNEIEQRNKHSGRFGGGAVVKRWTNGVVPYVIASYFFSAAQRQIIRSAIDDYNRKTCLFFRPYQKGDKNVIRFQWGSGCSSYVGMVGGVQPVSLYHGTSGTCVKKGIIIHELAHALGIFHEQSRPDRDSYVKIIRNNIDPDKLRNFVKYAPSVINSYGVPYDYYSVMHYSKTAFAKTPDTVTIETLDPEYQDVIGQRTGLSDGDLQLIRAMYRCGSPNR